MDNFDTESIIKNVAGVKDFDFEGNEIQTIMFDNEPYFVGTEITAILGYSNSTKAIKDHVDEEDCKTLSYGAFNESLKALWQGNDYSNKVLINESGLYSLILSSKLPSAKRFKRWVTKEVLPTIRKTGGYQQRPLTIQEQIKLLAQSDNQVNERLENIEQRMGLPGNMAHEFTQRRNKKIIQVLGGKDSNAYQDKQSRSRTYRAMFAAYKNVFMQDRYNDVPLKRFDEVVKFVGNWFPPYELQSEIQATNAQGDLFKGA